MRKLKIQRIVKKKNKPRVPKKQILWLSCGLFLVCSVFLTIQGASTGVQLLVLEEEKLRLIAKNQELSTKLIESTSLLKAGEVAEELGFFQPGETLYIKEKESVANLP